MSVCAGRIGETPRLRFPLALGGLKHRSTALPKRHDRCVGQTFQFLAQQNKPRASCGTPFPFAAILVTPTWPFLRPIHVVDGTLTAKWRMVGSCRRNSSI